MTAAKKHIKLLTIILAMCMLATLAPPAAEASFSPPTTTLRIGLFFGSTALPSANLQNVQGHGSGFEFGYYDSNRNFVSVGAWTSENRISMMMDRNMTWDPSGFGAGEYREGTDGPIVVGCFHIQRHQGYGTFEEARAEAANHQDAFVRYSSGQFLVLHGNYTSRQAAENAIASMGLSGATVNAGTANTITVTRTGTDTIIFEFESGTSPLGVRPRPSGNTTPETWFRGFRYNGGFQYDRRDGALLTVSNIVNVEDYVKGVLPYEMSNTWPIEALKAQALCARTYAMTQLNRHSAHGFDLCVEEHCQVYRGRGAANARTDRAVDETAGMYVTHNGRLAQTFYASSNGGASENVENVWFDPLPYLRGVIDPFEANIASRASGYNWTITYTPAQLSQRLQSRGHNLANIASVRVSEFSPTGNVVSVIITDVNGRSQTFSRRGELISALGVPSQRFTIGGATAGAGLGEGGIFANDPPQAVPAATRYYSIDSEGRTTAVARDAMRAISGSGSITAVEGGGAAGGAAGGSGTGLSGGVFTITGTGRGHNVGMSQWGAFSMAQYHNKTFEDIIHFYFTGVQITRT